METGVYNRVKWTLDDGVLLLEPSEEYNASEQLLSDFSRAAVKSIKTKGIITFEEKELIGMFRQFKNLRTADLSGFDTKEAVSFQKLFSDCVNLREVNLSSFDTRSAINFSGMFAGCERLLSLIHI